MTLMKLTGWFAKNTIDHSSSLNGWTLGTGVELKINPATVIGLEYNYINLDGDRFAARTSFNGPYNVDLDEVTVHTLMGRVTFMLNFDRAREPLK